MRIPPQDRCPGRLELTAAHDEATLFDTVTAVDVYRCNVCGAESVRTTDRGRLADLEAATP